jgi:hypothetical protein
MCSRLWDALVNWEGFAPIGLSSRFFEDNLRELRADGFDVDAPDARHPS